MLRGTWNPDLEVVEEAPPSKPNATHPRFRKWAVVILLVGLLVGASAVWALYRPGVISRGAEDPTGPRWRDESSTHFRFAAAADFGDVADPDTIAIAQRARAAGMSFLLAIGDLGDAIDGTDWCDRMKDFVPELVIGTGNQEAEENEIGNISEHVKRCPFPLTSPVVPGVGTPGYGYEYYFDYPAKEPIARFIVLSPGLAGVVDYDYSEGSPHAEWMEDAVEDARNRGIPWVIAASFAPCLTVGQWARCSMGEEIFEELLEAEVDLLLMGDDHVYARSRQLKESDECDPVSPAKEPAEACIVADGTMGVYPKGAGTVVVLQGVGGETLHDVALNASASEIEYFVEAMGANANTQGGLPGFGSVMYTVTEESITASTDFCPTGSVAPDGRCTADSAAVFADRFVITDEGFNPAPGLPRHGPSVSSLAGTADAIMAGRTGAARVVQTTHPRLS